MLKKTIRDFLFGRVSFRRVLLTFISILFVWFILNFLAGFVQLGAGGVWENWLQPVLKRVIPVYVALGVTPILICVPFFVGLYISKKIINDSKSNPIIKPLVSNNSDIFEDFENESNEFLPMRYKARMGFITEGEYIAFVMYLFHQKKIGEKKTRNLLREYSYELRKISEDVYSFGSCKDTIKHEGRKNDIRNDN